MDLVSERPNLVKTDNGSYIDTSDTGEPIVGLPRLSITDEEGLILSEYANGKDVLEIGTGLGVSTCYLASTAKSVVTVDVDPWVAQNVALPSNVKLFIEPPLIDSALRFDLVFIDGNHLTENVIRDIDRAMHHIKPDGVIILHDANYDNVERGFRVVRREWQIIKTTHGLGLLDLHRRNNEP